MTNPENYWHAYYDQSIIERSITLRQDYFIETSGVRLHVEAYLQSDPNMPMILLNHGEGGYSRMMVGTAMALYDAGFSVLIADQRGHGFSSGRDLDFSIRELAQDVLDVAHWTRRSFSGPLFLAGINGGSGLAYAAAANGAPVVGLICHHLYDFSQPAAALDMSPAARLARLPGGTGLATGLVRVLMGISPRMRLPLNRLAKTQGILDERDNGRYEAWRNDPYAARSYSLRFAVSAFSTPPAVPFEENALNVLVINPLRDRMIAPAWTRHSYERLSGPKQYQEIDYGHWSMSADFSSEWAALVSDWTQSVMALPA